MPERLARPPELRRRYVRRHASSAFASGSIAVTAAFGPFHGRWRPRERRLRIRNVRIGARGRSSDQEQPGANLRTVNDERQEPGADAWENEGGPAQERPEKSDRDEFFSNQEQLDRPDDQSNGEKASRPGSNPDRSI